MTTIQRIMKYLGEHWKTIALATAALTVAAMCIFFPPTIIAFGVLVLASSPAFAVFGASAVGVATVVVAGLAAATVIGVGQIGDSLVKGMNWFASKISKLFSHSRAPDAPPAPPLAAAGDAAALAPIVTHHAAWASAQSARAGSRRSASFDNDHSPEVAFNADDDFRELVASPQPHRGRRASVSDVYAPARVLLGAETPPPSPVASVTFTSAPSAAPSLLAPVPQRPSTPYPHSSPYDEINDSLGAAIASAVTSSHAAPAPSPSSPTGYAASIEEEYSTSPNPVLALSAARSASPTARTASPLFHGVAMAGPAAQVAGAASLMIGTTSLAPKPLSPLGLATGRIPSALDNYATAAAASSHLRASGLGFLTPPPERTRKQADGLHLPALIRQSAEDLTLLNAQYGAGEEEKSYSPHSAN